MYIDRKFSSLSSSFFKPIVATSLLFLLPSLGMGDDSTGTYTWNVAGDTGPKISVTTTESSQPTNLSWSNACSGTSSTPSCTTTGSTVTWSSDTNNTWAGTFNSGSEIKYLILRFDNTDSSTKDKSFVYLNTSSSVANVYASSTNASAITADFNNENLSITKLELYLSGTGTKNITVKDLNTLNGGLNIGSTSTTGTTENQYTYDVTVNTINGNLTVFGSNYSLKGTVTIKNALNGSIYVSRDSAPGPNTSTTSTTAALTLNFVEGATMTGDILDRVNGSAGIRKDIYFTGAGSGKTVFTGNIVSFGTSSLDQYLNTSTGNRIYFTQGDMKGYIIASTGQGNSSNVGKKGLNVVIFGDTDSQTIHTLTGGILASDIQSTSGSTDTSTKQATNVIVLADSTTLNIQGSGTTTVGSFANGELKGGDDAKVSDSQFDVTSGSIVARNFGVNEIRIYKDSTLNLNNGSGSIKSYISSKTSVTNTSNSSVTGTTVVDGSALNKINFLSEGGTINGSIIADNSGNSTSTTRQASALIYVANNASGTITGNLEVKAQTSGSKTNGRLTITLGSSNMTNVTGVNLKNNATTDSTSGTNTSTLTLQGSSNTITGLTTSAVSGSTNTANLVLDSSKSTGENGQTTTP